MEKQSAAATIMRIVGNAAGPVGIGITLTGWLNAFIGVACLVFGTGYVIWELITLEVVVENIPGMLRFLGVIFVASIAIGLSFPSVSTAIRRQRTKQPVPTAEEIADAVAKRLPSSSENHGVTTSVTAIVSHAPPKSAQAPTPRSVTPRLGTGPEAYKDISDEQVGQWTIEEADKVQDLADQAMNSTIGSREAQTWRFTNDFKNCCLQDLIDLRTEVQRRLGVSAKDAEETQAWTMLFPQTKYPQPPSDQTNPMLARMYAVQLRKLGVRLKRRAVPRGEPVPLQFFITRIPPDKPEFPQRLVVTIATAKDITAGYVAVEHEGPVAGLGSDFEDSTPVLTGKDVENKTLARVLDSKIGNLYVMQVGKTPFQA